MFLFFILFFIDLQCCVNFCCTINWLNYTYIFFPILCFFLLYWSWFNTVLISAVYFVSLSCSVQSLRRVWLFATPWTAAHQASCSKTNSWSLFKLMSIESVMLSNHLILCYPLLLPPSIFPSIRVFSNGPKYWSFSLSISPSNEYSGLISFRMDSLYLLAVQGTLKSLLQHHSSKALLLWCSAFFMIQLSHPYMSTGETIALTRWTFVGFVGKVISLLFFLISCLGWS